MKRITKHLETKHYFLFLTLLMAFASLSLIDDSAAASMIYVNGSSGNDDWDGETPETAKATIQNGTDTVDPEGTVSVADGIYPEHIIINKNLSLLGQSTSGTIIDGTNNGRPLTINGYTTIVNLINFTLINGNVTGTTARGGGIYNEGNLTLTNCNLINNTATGSIAYGGGIWSEGTYDHGALTLNNCMVEGNTATGTGAMGGGIAAYNTVNINNSKISGNLAEATGYGAYGGGIAGLMGTLTITDSQITGNTAKRGTLSDASGGGVYLDYNQFTITGSQITGNVAEGNGGGIYAYVSNDRANFNRIVNNLPDAIYYTYETVAFDALYNWWGQNTGPADGSISGNVDYDPWLVMNYSANPTTIQQGETSTLTADFRYDSDGTFHDPALGHLPDGIPVTFNTNLGNVGSKTATSLTLNGIATILLRGDEAAGGALTYALLDLETRYATVTIAPATVNAASTVSSKTIGMQETGVPLAGIYLSLLLVMGGLLSTRKE